MFNNFYNDENSKAQERFNVIKWNIRILVEWLDYLTYDIQDDEINSNSRLVSVL